MKRTFAVASGLLVATTMLFLTLTARGAPTATISVTTTADTVADDGECSLREAITAANTDVAVGGCAAGEENTGFSFDTIEFAIPGDGPHAIAVQSPLPEITDAVNIDGLSQEGASCVSNIPARRGGGTVQSTVPMIELNGSALSSGSGLVFSAEAGGGAARGLVINRFPGSGIESRTTDFGFGVNVFCSFIGTDSSGKAAAPNGADGIWLLSSPANSIQSNIIAGNEGWGIRIQGTEATDNRIEDNTIGTNAGGTELGNRLGGILAQNSGPQIIGGTYTNAGECCVGNTIAFNGGAGVAAVAAGSVSWEKGIRGNRIYANEGLGIDLENDGVTPNDEGDGDGDGAANQLQNFPAITAAAVTVESVTITGTLNSATKQSFVLDFFASDACDSSGYGEGQRFLGFERVTTDTGGDVAFTATFTETAVISLVGGGDQITATATDVQNNTSEFSACVQATGADTVLDRDIYLPRVEK